MPPQRLSTLCFGPFELDVVQRILRNAGTQVELGSRSMDVLIALVEAPGRLVTHRYLTERVWPDSAVSSSALRVHVSALRRSLGDGIGEARYIVNEHGRGYRFVAQLVEAQKPAREGSNLPAPIGRLIGRMDVLGTIVDAYRDTRLLTLVGPGGIGKSTTAVAAATLLAEDNAERVYFIDLALIQDEAEVGAAIASTLGGDVLRNGATRDIAQIIQDQPVLILLDNCEHVLPALQRLIEALLPLSPNLRILATSREPLRVRTEQIIRLGGMDVPPPHMQLSAEAATAFSAVELFVERATSAAPGFRLTDINATQVGNLCRQVDGIPLAIEFSAGWIGLLSLEEIALGLDDQLLTLSGGRRTALPRNRTLFAVLDWSYQSLTANEQVLIAELGVFRGSFSVETARSVVGLGSEPGLDMSIRRLAETSLLSSEYQDGVARFRMLETTRAYAQKRLQERPNQRDIHIRHAHHCIALIQGADEALLRVNRRDWSHRYGPVLADVRAALGWAFSPGGDPELGVALACVSMQLALQSVLASEFRQYFVLALKHMRARKAAVDPRAEIRLEYTLNMLGADQGGPSPQVSAPLLDAALTDDPVPEDLAARFGASFTRGEYNVSRDYADQVLALGERHGVTEYIYAGSRMRAQVEHYLGNHREALRLATWVLDGPLQFLPLTNVSHHISMRLILARMHFLQGDPTLAERVAREGVEMARESNPPALCQALTAALIPVQAWRGDYDAAQESVALLKHTAHKHDMQYWIDWAEGLSLSVDFIGPGGIRRDAELLFALSLRNIPAKLADLMATLHPRLVTPLARRRVEMKSVGWSAPEVLRAEALRQHDATERQRLLGEALHLAREQNAVFFVDRAQQALASPEGLATLEQPKGAAALQ